ncbi:MAG: hypothetical protein ACK56C_05100 [Alphaproteobacteria bacterium]
MNRIVLFAGTLIAAATLATAASASAFCDGFEAGWKSAFENRGKLVQLTPLCPLAPLGRDTFQGGYEMGLLAALSKMN